MTRRQALVADWRRRLLAARDALQADEGNAASRQSWLARVQIRVLTYLLRRYGTPDRDSDWPVGPHLSTSPPVAPLVRIVPVAGAPPKSTAQIRSVLEAAQSANAERHAHGPMQGIEDDAPRVVAAFHWPGLAEDCADALRRHGISAASRGWSRPTQVFVRHGDYQRAREIASPYMARDTSRKAGLSSDPSFTMMLAALSPFAGFILSLAFAACAEGHGVSETTELTGVLAINALGIVLGAMLAVLAVVRRA